MNTSIKTVLILIGVELTSADPFWDPLGIFSENTQEIESYTTTQAPVKLRTADFNSSYIIVGKWCMPKKKFMLQIHGKKVAKNCVISNIDFTRRQNAKR